MSEVACTQTCVRGHGYTNQHHNRAAGSPSLQATARNAAAAGGFQGPGQPACVSANTVFRAHAAPERGRRCRRWRRRPACQNQESISIKQSECADGHRAVRRGHKARCSRCRVWLLVSRSASAPCVCVHWANLFAALRTLTSAHSWLLAYFRLGSTARRQDGEAGGLMGVGLELLEGLATCAYFSTREGTRPAPVCSTSPTMTTSQDSHRWRTP